MCKKFVSALSCWLITFLIEILIDPTTINKIPALVSLDFLLPAVQVLIISLSFFFCINRKMLNIIKCWYFTNCHYDAYTEDINMINSWPCFFHLVTLCNELPWSIRERLVHQFNELVQIINQPLPGVRRKQYKACIWCSSYSKGYFRKAFCRDQQFKINSSILVCLYLTNSSNS